MKEPGRTDAPPAAGPAGDRAPHRAGRSGVWGVVEVTGALGMGKLGAHRAQLFERHRPDRPLRPRTVRLAADIEPSPLFVRSPRSWRDAAGAHRGRLRLPRRPPAAARSGRDQHRALDRRGASYYESMGQNWERAAMIKARPSPATCRRARPSWRELVPFIWRKYLDFAAIADVHSIKRQIHDTSRPRRRSPSRATTSSSAAAASARSSSSPRRSSSSPAAAIPSCAVGRPSTRSPRSPQRLDHAGARDELPPAYGFLRGSSIACR
jgi:hypothetical protein